MRIGINKGLQLFSVIIIGTSWILRGWWDKK